MFALEEYQAILQADARAAAERSLRNKFGRLSNRRILNVLRPAAERVNALRGCSDGVLLDDWFAAFERLRIELRSVS